MFSRTLCLDSQRLRCPVFTCPRSKAVGDCAPRVWRTHHHGQSSPIHLRPQPGQRPGRRRAGPPEPPAGADEPAAAAGRSLVASKGRSDCTGSRPASCPTGAAPPGDGRPRPARGHRRRQSPAARGDHHRGRALIGRAASPGSALCGRCRTPLHAATDQEPPSGQTEADQACGRRMPSRCGRRSKPA